MSYEQNGSQAVQEETGRTWLKAELHAHTLDDPEDGGIIIPHSAFELIDRAAEQRFDVLAITNHNQQLYNEELDDYAAKRGILLIPGVEATVKRKHVLLYNFPDYDPAWDSLETVRDHKGPKQLVVAPHPFFPGVSCLRGLCHRWAGLFDAVEYNHFYLEGLNFNRRAVEFARRHELPLVGNSDVHQLSQLGCTFTMIQAEKTVDSVIEAIRRGRVRLVTKPLSAYFVSSWLAGNLARKVSHSLRSAAASFFS
jgi:predicted metal-dependent phosphoesterase TrpH